MYTDHTGSLRPPAPEPGCDEGDAKRAGADDGSGRGAHLLRLLRSPFA